MVMEENVLSTANTVYVTALVGAASASRVFVYCTECANSNII